MLYRKSIIAFWHYCSVETFQLLVINEINSSFGMGNLSSTSKSYWRVSKTITFFFYFKRATGLLRGNQWAWILPSFFCALRTKKYDRFIFLFKSHISLFLAKYIFLCSWCHTQMQPSNGHQADRSFLNFFLFLFQMDHKFELWVPLKSLLFLWG